METIFRKKSIDVSLRYYQRLSFMTVLAKNNCSMTIDLWLETPIPCPTHVSLSYIWFIIFWWRPFLHKKSIDTSLWY